MQVGVEWPASWDGFDSTEWSVLAWYYDPKLQRQITIEFLSNKADDAAELISTIDTHFLAKQAGLYLDETNPSFWWKFLESYLFLAGFGQLDVVSSTFIPPSLFSIPSVKVIFPEHPEITKKDVLKHNTVYITYSTDATLYLKGRPRDLHFEVKQFPLFSSLAKKHLKRFAKGLGMWLTRTRQPQYILTFDEENTTLPSVSITVTAYHREGQIEHRDLIKIIRAYEQRIPNLVNRLKEMKYIMADESSIDGRPSLYIFQLQPLSVIKKVIKRLAMSDCSCPICGTQIRTIRMHKRTKVCKSCQMRLARLRKHSRDIIRKDPHISPEEFVSTIKRLKEKQNAWLIKKGRAKEVWQVNDWDKLSLILWDEVMGK